MLELAQVSAVSTRGRVLKVKSYVTREVNGQKVHYGADYIHTIRSYSVPFAQAVSAVSTRGRVLKGRPLPHTLTLTLEVSAVSTRGRVLKAVIGMPAHARALSLSSLDPW